jgi:hypothetical protein
LFCEFCRRFLGEGERRAAGPAPRNIYSLGTVDRAVPSHRVTQVQTRAQWNSGDFFNDPGPKSS